MSRELRRRDEVLAERLELSPEDAEKLKLLLSELYFARLLFCRLLSYDLESEEDVDVDVDEEEYDAELELSLDPRLRRFLFSFSTLASALSFFRSLRFSFSASRCCLSLPSRFSFRCCS